MLCLPKEMTKKFLQSLKNGEIDPAKLSEMTSEERRSFFEGIVGKNDAQAVNALFESKLLLKNQQQGMINWAKAVGGMKETVRRDIIAKIERLDRVLGEKEQDAFLKDLASTRLGTEVSFEEAQKIAELSRTLAEASKNVDSGETARLEYGKAKVDLMNYVNDLKLGNESKTFGEHMQDMKTRPIGKMVDAISTAAGTSKAIKASLDASAIGRQGFRTIFTNPKIWAENSARTISNMVRQLGRKAADNTIMDSVKADVYSRDNARNGSYKRMGLDIGTGEEAFPTTLPEKIPLFNRLYKASEVGYTGFLMRVRADIADKLIDVADRSGVDLTDDFQMRSIGKLINSLTGRGSLGSFEKVGKPINNIFFSPKSMKAHFDFLTMHGAEKMSPFARKQAAINLLKVASGVAVILAIAKALKPDSVDYDARSADFGKVVAGDTSFDVSGGSSSMITLAARLLMSSTKSSTSGKVTKINTGKFGSQTSTDVFVNFLTNKLSPAASTVKTIANQRDFNGDKPTVLGELGNLFMPLPVSNLQELMADPNGANVILAGIADSLGISTNTYKRKKK